jgi:hypothetical protein
MARRFQEQESLRQVQTATGAAAGFQSLASRLDQFSSKMQQQARVSMAQEAEIAGQEGQAAYDPSEGLKGLAKQRKEVPTFFGHDEQAYNKGLRAAYVAGATRDNRLKLAEFAAENPEDIAAFNDQAESHRSGLLKELDPAAAQIVLDQFDKLANQYQVKVQGATIAKNKRLALGEQESAAQTAASDASRFAREGDMVAAADALLENRLEIEQMDIDPQAKAKLIRDAERESVEQGHLGNLERTFDNDSPQAAMDQLDELSDTVPAGFSADEWDSFVDGAQTTLNRKMARQAKATKEDLKALKLDRSIKRGLLFTDPAIPADPAKSSQDRKDVNNYYNSVSTEWVGLPVQAQVNQNVDFVKNTGLIPDTLISNINASMRSGTPEQVALMADVITRIQDVSPTSIKDIPEESRAIALQVGDATRAGVEPEVALEMARNATFGLTDAQKKTISMESQRVAKNLNKSLQSFVDVDIDEGGFDKGAFYRVPDVPAAMLGEYRSTFDNFMQMTNGNAEQAQKLAYQSVRSMWGISETGGDKRFMKYAPESIYGIAGVNDDWIENQFNEEMEAANHLGAVIAIDHSVAREDKPSYPVLVMDENTGLQKPLLDSDNQPLRWRPEFKATDRYQAVVEAPQEKITKAKRQRSISLEKRANEIRRMVQVRVLRGAALPFNERAAFLESEAGKEQVARAVRNLRASGRIDEAEANQALSAFGADDRGEMIAGDN